MSNSEIDNISSGIVLTTLPVDEAANLDRRSRNSGVQEQMELPLISDREKDQIKERGNDSADGSTQNYSSIRRSVDARRMGVTYSKLQSILESLRVALGDRFAEYIFDVPQQVNYYNKGRGDTSGLSLVITAHRKNNAPLSDPEMIGVKAYALCLLREAKRLINEINRSIIDKDVKGVILCSEDRGYSKPIFLNNYSVAKFVTALSNGGSKTSSQLLAFKIRHKICRLPEIGCVHNNVDDVTYRVVTGVVRLESATRQSFVLSGVFMSSQGNYEEQFNSVIYCVDGYPTDGSNWYLVMSRCASEEKEVTVTIDSIKKFVSLQGVKSSKYIVVNVDVREDGGVAAYSGPS